MEDIREIAPKLQFQEQLLRKKFSGNEISQMKHEIGAILHKYNFSVLEAKTFFNLILNSIDIVANDAHLWK